MVMDDDMEDFEIDAFDPVERCRRGREALGLDDDPRVDDQVADLSEDTGEVGTTESYSDRGRSPAALID